MTFIDDQTKSQPLLEQYGIILTPFVIDNDTLKELSWALHVGRELHPNKSLELRCNGDGGSADEALAVAELIRFYGNVDGVALGGISSAHTLIWAACARRYVGPYTTIKIHRSGYGEWVNGDDSDVQAYRVADLLVTEQKLAHLYASSSSKSVKWWGKQIKRTRKNIFLLFTAKQIVNDLEMARPLKKRKVSKS
ncbi:MAG: ATP-dependent Clp protease proteolytic subunit [Planctomycetota bacterium]|jgi:ATP-dependent protease ClpP protease subunit